MQILPPSNYKRLTGFFDKDFPEGVVANAILENHMPGEIWVNDLENPTACLIMSNANICFITGSVDKNLLGEFLKKLKSKPKLRLVYRATKKLKLINFLMFGLLSIDRLYFKLKHPRANYSVFPNDTTYELISLNPSKEKFLHSCIQFADGKKIFGGEENCIKHAWGLALWDRQKIKLLAKFLE